MLQNPNTSIGDQELEVKVIYKGEVLLGKEQRLAYEQDDPPQVTIRLKNHGRRPLFVGLLDLPDTFGIFALQPDRNCQKLNPGEETAAHDGESMPIYVPDQFWELGIGEITDVIKIIVSTREFDVRRLTQPDLEVPDPEWERRAMRGMETDQGVRGEGEDLGTLDRLMARVQTRHAGGGAAGRIDDWRTLQVTLTTSRPLPAQRLEAGQGATLTDGVRIEPHPRLAAASRGSRACRPRRGPSARSPPCPGCYTMTRASCGRSSSPPPAPSAAG